MNKNSQNEISAANENLNGDLVSLWEFIEKFQKIFAVTGVFIVLGLFWKNVHPEAPTPYISYLCFLIVMPLFLEVWQNYEQSKSSWNLVIFFQIFSGIILLSFLELIVNFPSNLATLLNGVIFVGVLFVFAVILDKVFNFLNNLAYQKAIREVKEIDKKGLSEDNRDKIVKLVWTWVKIDYKFNRFFYYLMAVFFLLLSFIISHFTNIILQAVFDKDIYSIEKIEVPPVNEK